MTPAEQDKFAEKVANILVSKQEKEQDFWIDGEKHYNDHIKFCGWVKFFEKCKEDVSAALRKLFVTGCIGVLGVGVYYLALSLN